MDTVGAERKFAIYTQFLDTTLWGETEVQEGETRQGARKRLLHELEEQASELRVEYESMRGQIIKETISWALRTSPPIGPPMPLEINIQTEDKDELKKKALDDILQCPSLSDLTSYKRYASTDKDLQAAYMKRLKELTQ